MAIDTRYDTCAVCAADEQCAIVANVPICGDCGKTIAVEVGEERNVDDLEEARADMKPVAPKKPRKAKAATVAP